MSAWGGGSPPPSNPDSNNPPSPPKEPTVQLSSVSLHDLQSSQELSNLKAFQTNNLQSSWLQNSDVKVELEGAWGSVWTSWDNKYQSLSNSNPNWVFNNASNTYEGLSGGFHILEVKVYAEEDGLGEVLLNESVVYNIKLDDLGGNPKPPEPPTNPEEPTDPTIPPRPPNNPNEPDLPSKIKIALVGDSTMATYSSSSSKQGWGYALPSHVEKSNTKVENHASGGKSTKSFYGARWDKVKKSGAHVVFIQFGHNDSASKNSDTKADIPTYKSFLRKYADESRSKNMIPIFVTPLRRIKFKNGKSTSSLTGYSNAMKDVAKEKNVRLLDLHDISGDQYTRWGEKKTRSYFSDSTHTKASGAHEIAKIIAREAPKVMPELSRHFK